MSPFPLDSHDLLPHVNGYSQKMPFVVVILEYLTRTPLMFGLVSFRYCLDSKKNNGPNKLKQPCTKRRCRNMPGDTTDWTVRIGRAAVRGGGGFQADGLLIHKVTKLGSAGGFLGSDERIRSTQKRLYWRFSQDFLTCRSCQKQKKIMQLRKRCSHGRLTSVGALLCSSVGLGSGTSCGARIVLICRERPLLGRGVPRGGDGPAQELVRKWTEVPPDV